MEQPIHYRRFSRIFLGAIFLLSGIYTPLFGQIQTGVFRTPTGNTTYHQFTRKGSGAAVYINQVDTIQPILALSSGTDVAGQGVKFTVRNNGSLGIGTNTPSQKLHVIGNVLAEGNISAHGNLVSNNPANTGAMVSLSWLNNVARIRVGGTGDGANGGFDIQSYSDQSLMRLLANGNVGIGTTSPTEKLSVKGKIRAQEIKVETANWADYVFRKGYQLPTLSETESYIQEHQHLPGIPSEEEVKKEGISLGEMNKKLLEKVEELTLHLIEQNRRINELEKKLSNGN